MVPLEINRFLSKHNRVCFGIWTIQVRNIVAQVRATRRRFMRLTLVHQNDKLHAVFRNFLAEDRHSETRLSYLDILCHLHKEIRSVLN